jgi:3-hydroxy acid dehydrogenase / malonic semialdehyde reductase
MNILITGTSSGIGKNIKDQLHTSHHHIFSIDRSEYDLDIQNVFNSYTLPANIDILINCAGHDIGGKVDFINHKPEHWLRIMNANLINAIYLTQLVLNSNKDATIINITSTNINQYYPDDLIYSLTKTALATFTDYLRIEYTDNAINFKEVRLGLTKTNFVKNRHKENHIAVIDLYNSHNHLTADEVGHKIIDFMFSNQSFIQINKESTE